MRSPGGGEGGEIGAVRSGGAGGGVCHAPGGGYHGIMRTDETGSVGGRSRIILFAGEGDVEGVMQAQREEASDRMRGFLGTSFVVDPFFFYCRIFFSAAGRMFCFRC